MLTSEAFLDFVYIGAPRAGSTWLAASLDAHPQIWIPSVKELHFFNERSVYTLENRYRRGISFYRSCFEDAPPDALLGDMSPMYYFDPEVAGRIRKHFPRVKILALLRNPVDVVYSFYLKRRSTEWREKTFEEEIEKHPEFLELGSYYTLMKPYFDLFPREQLFVQIYENFFSDEEAACREIYKFLGVDPEFKPWVIGKSINESSGSRPTAWTFTRGWILRLLNAGPLVPIKDLLVRRGIGKVRYEKMTKTDSTKPKLNPDTRRSLIGRYEQENVRLEKLLDTDLSIWRN